jgi:hypothetical protein
VSSNTGILGDGEASGKMRASSCGIVVRKDGGVVLLHPRLAIVGIPLLPPMSSQIIFLARRVPTVGFNHPFVSTVPSLIEEISIASY